MTAEDELRAAYSFYRKAEALGFSPEEQGERLGLLRYTAENLVKVRSQDPECEIEEKISPKETIRISYRWLCGATLAMEGRIRLAYPLEDSEQAVEVLKKAATYLPDNAAVWNSLTKACSCAYQREEAFRANARALEADPNDLTARQYHNMLTQCATIGVRPPRKPLIKYNYIWNVFLWIPICIIGIVVCFTISGFLGVLIILFGLGIWWYACRRQDTEETARLLGYDSKPIEVPRTL